MVQVAKAPNTKVDKAPKTKVDKAPNTKVDKAPKTKVSKASKASKDKTKITVKTLKELCWAEGLRPPREVLRNKALLLEYYHKNKFPDRFSPSWGSHISGTSPTGTEWTTDLLTPTADGLTPTSPFFTDQFSPVGDLAESLSFGSVTLK
jgi:hypothetical protein